MVFCTGVGSVGVARIPNEKLYEKPEGPAVVASRLFRHCNLVVLVHDSHILATKVKVGVPRDRTFIQNCAKKAGSWLTWSSQPQAVARSTVRTCPPHACSPW